MEEKIIIQNQSLTALNADLNDLMLSVAENNISKFTQIERWFTFEKVVTGKPLRQLQKQMGSDELTKVIYVLSKFTMSFFNLSQPMTDDQLFQTAALIAESYGGIKFEDLVIFYRELKSSNLGTIFNRIDGQVIMEKLNIYLEKQNEDWDEYERQQKNRHQLNCSANVKLLTDLKIMDDELQNPKTQINSNSQNKEQSLEKYEIFLKENISEFSDDQITELIKNLKNNLWYERSKIQIIINTETSKRKIKIL